MQGGFSFGDALAVKTPTIQELQLELLQIKHTLEAREAKIKQFEQEQLIIKNESFISTAQVKMTAWQKEMLSKYFISTSDCFVHFDQHESYALLVGRHKSVKKQKLALLDELNKLIVKHLFLTPGMHSILSRELGKQYLKNLSGLKETKIFPLDESLLVTSKDCSRLDWALEFLKSQLNHKEIFELNAKVSLEKLRLLQSTLEQRLLVSCSVIDSAICVEGIKDDVMQSIREIMKFVATLRNHETEVPVSQGSSEETNSSKKAGKDNQEKLQCEHAAKQGDITKSKEDSEIPAEKRATGLCGMCIYSNFQEGNAQTKPIIFTHAEIPSRGTCEFLRYAADSTKKVPSYWNLNSSNNCERRLWPPIKSNIISKPEEQSMLVDVDIKTRDAIEILIGKTCSYKNLKIEVIDVKRVENPQLFEQYSTQRQLLIQNNCEGNKVCPDIGTLGKFRSRIATTEQLDRFMKEELYYEVNEHYLFRGTKNPGAICSNGIAPRVFIQGGMLRSDIYLAEKFTKSDQHTDSQGQRSNPGKILTMILARVLLGNVFACNESPVQLTRPPCMTCQEDKCDCVDKTRYDSVMWNPWGTTTFTSEPNYRDFVIYDRNRLYPEYLIYYQRI